MRTLAMRLRKDDSRPRLSRSVASQRGSGALLIFPAIWPLSQLYCRVGGGGLRLGTGGKRRRRRKRKSLKREKRFYTRCTHYGEFSGHCSPPFPAQQVALIKCESGEPSSYLYQVFSALAHFSVRLQEVVWTMRNVQSTYHTTRVQQMSKKFEFFLRDSDIFHFGDFPSSQNN